jgi:hypothetical protein
MRIRVWTIWLVLCTGLATALEAGPARIIKVLPHYLDLKGRQALSPSLYERDAYQAFLREHPEQRSGLEFDVNWKANLSRKERLVLRLEIRTSERDLLQPLVLEENVRPRRYFSRWTALRLSPEVYATFGKMIAWRATLWRGEELLAEQKSFLW